LATFASASEQTKKERRLDGTWKSLDVAGHDCSHGRSLREECQGRHQTVLCERGRMDAQRELAELSPRLLELGLERGERRLVGR
jgi:hypothetical protein